MARLALAAFVSVLLALPLSNAPAFADTSAMALWTPPPAPSRVLRMSMYALQLADATLSGITDTRLGAHEGNPQMKPFSHGGVPMFIVGYAAWDILSGALERRFRPSQKNALAVAQIGSNINGILTTVATARTSPAH